MDKKNKGLVEHLPEDDEVQMNDEEIQQILADQIIEAMKKEKIQDENQVPSQSKGKLKRWQKVLIGVGGLLLILAAVICYFLCTKQGRDQVIDTVGDNLYDGMVEYEERKGAALPQESDSGDAIPGIVNPVVEHPEADVVNILLLGVEEIKGAKNTDVMMVASMNRKTKELTLVSLMRDLYIDIPGHSKNRINAAVALGGNELLYQTIEHNFGLNLDGYMSVNFEAFEKIVDLLGGVEVTLTRKEANYLNKENYISNKAYRNVHEGTQVMNGNQALGYCRIRKVATAKEANDYGRTARHRAVIQAMYNRLKQKNLMELVNFMNDVMDNVKIRTDIPKEDFKEYLKELADMKVEELKQYRIPADGTFTGQSIHINNAKKAASVLVPNDMEETKSLLHEFIYGKDENLSPTPIE